MSQAVSTSWARQSATKPNASNMRALARPVLADHHRERRQGLALLLVRQPPERHVPQRAVVLDAETFDQSHLVLAGGALIAVFPYGAAPKDNPEATGAP
ncbi:hypothetical protein [Sphaerotilus microaerophilus]|uniref:hypothetical protein n=1 Tax=Sphaerotilus microaerophilus TaxID=2914710 RepID=UPI00207335F2|nr:hypothetical protein [Sphaerotilus sp. FB-5]